MKKIMYLLVVLLGFASCQPEVIEPTPPPTPPPSDAYTMVKLSTENELIVDSIVYLNSTTNFKQVVTNPSMLLEPCNGIAYNNHTLNLTSNYVSGDGCTITVYFEPLQGYKTFSILLLKNGEDVCEGAGGNGGICNTSFDSYTITKNL